MGASLIFSTGLVCDTLIASAQFLPAPALDKNLSPVILFVRLKSRGEGASSLFRGWPGSLENVSCTGATPDLHRCKSEVALEQETFLRLPGHHPLKRLLAPPPIDSRGIQESGHCTRQSGSQILAECSQFCLGSFSYHHFAGLGATPISER